jgi:hypothetical protein
MEDHTNKNFTIRVPSNMTKGSFETNFIHEFNESTDDEFNESTDGIIVKVPKMDSNISLDSFLTKGTGESINEFLVRKTLTKKIDNLRISGSDIDQVVVISLGQLIMKKAKLNVSYDNNIENIISFIMDSL